MASTTEFYLAVGSVLTESVTTKISTSGNDYVSKLLSSSPENWRTIASLLRRSDLVGSIVKLTGKDFDRIHTARYSQVSRELFQELAKIPHLLLVHEAVALAPQLEQDSEKIADDLDSDTWNDQTAKAYFGTVGEETRKHVHQLLQECGLIVTTYKKNAEASTLAALFVEDSQSNLLLRIYVPAGRLYEDEFSKLLELFHDWLRSVKHQPVRQGGYRTSRGRVIEFYGERGAAQTDVNGELREFAAFLSVLDSPEAAEAVLHGLGLGQPRAQEVVTRYSKALRRLILDTKHERDRRVLAIRQQLESELIDDLPATTGDDIGGWVQQLVPMSPFSASPVTDNLSLESRSTPQVILHQQVFHHVEGVVAQHLSGDVALGKPADDLIEIVRRLGGNSKDDLEAAARELADPGAPASARFGARQKLKDFMARNGQRIETAAFQTMWRWLETQIGS